MKLTQRMTKATTRGIIAVAGLALLLGAQAAMATPITSFNYTSHVGFISWTDSGSSTGADITSTNPHGGVVPSIAPQDGSFSTMLSWGDPSNNTNSQSSLELGVANVSGSVTPNSGIAAPDGSMTHNNFVITGDHLTTATIRGVFTITAAAPPGGTLGPGSTDFFINFDETDNAGPCAGGTPTPCADIFVLNNPDTLKLNIPGLAFGAGFADYNYLLTLGTLDSSGNFSVLPTLLPQQCAAAGVASGCRGFTTNENTSTTINLGFTIDSFANVPEPMPIALFGLGLLALGVMLRRRRRTDHSND